MNTNYFAVTDGGFYPFVKSEIDSNIGYTDGVPFIQNSINYPLKSDEKIKGFSYGYLSKRGEIRCPEGIKSQNTLYELGCNWVCLSVVNYQKAFYSTDIHADYLNTPTDRDIAYFVKNAHSKSIKVCLKPMLNSEDNMWRAHIGFPDLNMDDMDIYWSKWFKSYNAYILHYAELAEELKCEMLCIGCEMLGTEHRKKDWVDLINTIRKVYSGKIVYNTNHDHEDTVEWFDMLDYIGTSAYYPVGKNGTDKKSMIEEWTKIKWKLNAISESRKKKYIFMEIGCRSVDGASIQPWDFSNNDIKFNEEEQANFYESCMEVFMPEEKFAGMFWWNWSTFIYNDIKDAKTNMDFDVRFKKAEEVLKNFYSRY